MHVQYQYVQQFSILHSFIPKTSPINFTFIISGHSHFQITNFIPFFFRLFFHSCIRFIFQSKLIFEVQFIFKFAFIWSIQICCQRHHRYRYQQGKHHHSLPLSLPLLVSFYLEKSGTGFYQ